MVEPAEEAPKHPYVTEANAKVHLIFSSIIIALSVLQLVLGIIMSEVMVNFLADLGTEDRSYYSYSQRETNYMMGDGVWIAMIGLFNGLLGLSVWKTRSRVNGVLLTVFLFLSFFLAYTTACGLSFLKPSGGAMTVGILNALCTAVTGLVTLVYAFYTSFHACCNSKVRKERRVVVPPGMTVPQQGQQIVYLQQPVQAPGQFVQQPGQYVQQVYTPGQQQVYLPAQGNVYTTQPPQYAGQAQYAGQPAQQHQERPDLPPVYTTQPPQYAGQAQYAGQPAQQHQERHGLTPSPRPADLPPVYTEKAPAPE